MKKFELNFSFKGDRQYVHGTDMLDKSGELLCEYLSGNLEQINFVIHRMTDRNLSLVLYSAAQISQLGAIDVAELKFLIDGRPWEARLINTESRPTNTCLYEENAVTELCQVDEGARQVFLRHDAPYTNIETLVAMTKMLHLKMFPSVTDSWVFCRWDSPRWPLDRDLNGVCIHLKQTLGTRLTKSEVSLNHKVLGYIYFSARNNK